MHEQRLKYSQCHLPLIICKTCGIPEEVCPCEEIAKGTQQIRITSESRRYGKVVTIIDGFDAFSYAGRLDLHELARKLKVAVAAGGTTKKGRIELQGEHCERVKRILQKLGYRVRLDLTK